MKEVWKDIVGYEGLYQVSSFGDVRRITKKGYRVLKPRLGTHPYYAVNLCKNGKVKNCQVHRLVAGAFIPNPDNLPQVNHKDENKLNNNVENLEWCDAKYNSNYGTHNYRMIKSLSKPVYQYDENGELVGIWDNKMLASDVLGIRQDGIKKSCTRKTKYKGYFWRWVLLEPCDFKSKGISPMGYWKNYDNCLNAAKECKSRSDFKLRYDRAYVQSKKNGWLDEFFPKAA